MDSRELIKILDLSYIDDKGSTTKYIFIEEKITARDIVSITIESIDEAIEILPSDKVPEWLIMSMKDTNVEKVLRLIAKDSNSWVGIYRIFEVIENDIGALTKYDWVTKTNIKRFTHSANSVTVSGDEARHGKETNEPPKNPMSISEAKAFISQIIHSWLNEKIERKNG